MKAVEKGFGTDGVDPTNRMTYTHGTGEKLGLGLCKPITDIQKTRKPWSLYLKPHSPVPNCTFQLVVVVQIDELHWRNRGRRISSSRLAWTF